MDFTGLDIRESVTDAEGEALTKLAESVAREGMLIAEVGSWKGFSTAYLASVAKAHHGLVLAVDHWRGNVGTWNEPVAKSQDVFAIFRQNMKALGFEDIVIPWVTDSKNVSYFLQTPILDLVFIDADHRATPFNTDLSIWLQTVRQDGILCGHDCEAKYSALSQPEQDFILQYIEQDFVGGKHYGIIWTLYKVFKDRYDKIPDTLLWCWRRGINGTEV